MFFAIAALVVSAIEIGVGVWIGLSVAKYRRGHPARALTAVDSLPVSPDFFDDDRRPNDAGALEALDAAAAPAITIARPNTAVRTEPVRARNAADDRARRSGKPSSAPGDVPPVTLPAGAERRQATRRTFAFRQQVAPYHGGSLPGKASFREVECQDISSTGFSFLSTQLPDFDSLVVALGAPPRLTYLQAQIVNRFPVNDSKAPLYRIGCRFSGQVMPW